MAVSRYAYVRDFELPDNLLPRTFIIVRIDGHAFSRFTDVHHFKKPNDTRGLELMDHAAVSLMREYPDIVLGFGQSDEYSFLLRKTAALYNRRQSKITSILCSHFTSAYVMNWHTFFPDRPLSYPPSFDARVILYPDAREVRDYFSWRQADTHINNLYNTAFWAIIHQEGQSAAQAHEVLRSTVSSQKHEMLYSRFGINYNALPSRFRKGSVLVKEQLPDHGTENTGELSPLENLPRTNSLEPLALTRTLVGPEKDVVSPTRSNGKRRTKHGPTRIELTHSDIIKDDFWSYRPYLLED